MIIKKYYLELYRTTVLFICGCGEEVMKEELKKRRIELDRSSDNYDGLVLPYHIKQKTGGYDQGLLCYIRNQDRALYDLSHECVHLACETMNWVGIPINYENQEIIAYLQMYWFKKLFDEIANGKNT